MAELHVERKRSGAAVWVIILLLLVAAAAAVYFYTQQNRSGSNQPAPAGQKTSRLAPVAAFRLA